MIAPIKKPLRRATQRGRTPGLARAHRWISQTLLADGRPSQNGRKTELRAWLAVVWIVVVVGFYFGKLLVERFGSF